MATDFLTDDTGDLACVDGDLNTGESLQREVTDILLATKGDYKQIPLLGPNLHRWLKGKVDDVGLKRQVSIALEMDGKHLGEVKIESGNTLNLTIR